MPGQPRTYGSNGGRSALAPRPKLAQLLQQAVQPGEDDPLKASVQDILHGLAELKEKREVYEEADEYFDGSVGMVWASDRVREILERSGIEDIRDFNYAAIPVKRLASRLQISGVVAGPAEEADGDAGAPQTQEAPAVKAANREIARLRKVNQLDAEEKRLHMLACKYGEAYLLVWPGEDDDTDDGTSSGTTARTVDMRVNSPHNVIMIYDEEDSLRAKYALKSWSVHEDGKPVIRANLYYPDRIERWTTQPGGNADKDDAWFKLSAADFGSLDEEEVEEIAADEFFDPDEEGEGVGDDGPAGLTDDIPNPYGAVPFFHFRNDRPPYPEHRDAYGPQQMINKLVYGLAGTVDYSAFPQRYILMDPLKDDPMQNLVSSAHPDLDDDDPENEGGNAGLSAEPAAVWKLWGASAGQFEAASLAGFLDSLDRCVQFMSDLTGLPKFAFTSSVQLPSGESYREASADWTALVGDRITRYDATWQDAYEFALVKIMKIAGISVDVRWKPTQQVNDAAGWSVIQMKIAAGVPPQVALEEAGYAPEQVEAWVKDATGADLGRRVAILNQIATATQLLGASIVTGAVSAEQVQALIAALFADVMAGTDHQLPEAKDFLDPQAQLKAQQEMQDKQLNVQQQAQDRQLQHATQTQQAGQEHQMTMAEAAHERMRNMMQQSHQREDQLRQEDRQLGPIGQQPVRNGRRPGGRR
jgi:hypothetical protein